MLACAVVALGIGVGPALARASERLPGGGGRSPRRGIVFALACAGLAAWAQAVHPGAAGVLGAFLAWQLLLLATLDAEHFWLPLPLTLGLAVTGLLTALIGEPEALPARALGAVAGWSVLTAVAAGFRRLRGRDGLGGGDAWLLAGGGAWVGWIALPTVLVWAAAGGLVAVAGLALAGRSVARGQHLPFGVALAAGIWLAWLYGPIGRA